ncbi:MAG: hypothetical protein ACREFU_17185 [Acetobacteraceae bacterium]
MKPVDFLGRRPLLASPQQPIPRRARAHDFGASPDRLSDEIR